MGLIGRPCLEVRKRVVKEGGAVECHCVGDLIGNLATGRRQRGVRGRCHERGRNDLSVHAMWGMKMDAKKAGQLRLPIKIGLF